MLRRKAVRKIAITTFSVITIFIICIMQNNFGIESALLDIPIETTYVANSNTADVYLLGVNNYLTKATVLIDDAKTEDKIFQIIQYLTKNGSSKLPNGLSAIIPENTKLNSITIESGIAILDFNELLFKVDKDLEERVVEAITYSLIELDGIEGIKIRINGTDVLKLPSSKKNLPLILNRNFGINKVFEIDDFHDVNKVVLYYICNIDDKNYYVPVTKYLNDDRDKIKIIIENLSSNYIYESSLMSILSPNTELIDYEIEDDIMKINFNQNLFTSDKLLEEIVYPISESVFKNYDINKIIFQIDGKNIDEIEK